MADGHAHQEHQRRDQPVVLGGKSQRVVVGQHQEHNRQRQVVVVGRAQLGDLAVFGIRRAAFLQVLHHDALVRHDDEKHVCGHDGRGESAQMQHHGAAGEDLVVAPAHDHQQDEQQHHQEGRLFPQRRFAQEIVNDPADGQRCAGNQDALPQRQVGLAGVNKVQLPARPIDDHQQAGARQPGGVALPFEPDQMVRHVLRRHQVFLDVIKTAAMDLPFLTMRADRQVRNLPQAKIQRNEVEGRSDPGNGGDDMKPADRKAQPVPHDHKLFHCSLLISFDPRLEHGVIFMY